MLKKIERHLSEALKMINASIQDGAAKESIANELEKAMKLLKKIKIGRCELSKNYSNVFRFEIIDCTDLAYAYGSELCSQKFNMLEKLIIDNIDKIQIPTTESLLYIITDRYSYQEIFNYCPEIIEFLDSTSNQS